MTRAMTLGDLRATACSESAPLWVAVGLPGDTPVSVLRERWTPLAACLLAAADGRGPRVGAVAWVDRVLGTAVLRGADLRRACLRGAYLRGADLTGADMEGADMDGADVRSACLTGVRATEAPDGWVLRKGRLWKASRGLVASAAGPATWTAEDRRKQCERYCGRGVYRRSEDYAAAQADAFAGLMVGPEMMPIEEDE